MSHGSRKMMLLILNVGKYVRKYFDGDDWITGKSKLAVTEKEV